MDKFVLLMRVCVWGPNGFLSAGQSFRRKITKDVLACCRCGVRGCVYVVNFDLCQFICVCLFACICTPVRAHVRACACVRACMCV